MALGNPYPILLVCCIYIAVFGVNAVRELSSEDLKNIGESTNQDFIAVFFDKSCMKSPFMRTKAFFPFRGILILSLFVSCFRNMQLFMDCFIFCFSNQTGASKVYQRIWQIIRHFRVIWSWIRQGKDCMLLVKRNRCWIDFINILQN